MKVKSYLGDYSGKLDGFVAATNRGGLYFRAKGNPVNPRTTQQTIARNRMSGLATRWGNVLTDVQRAGFEILAEAFPQPDRQGGTQQLSGIAMYQKINCVRLNAGDSILDDAPADLEVQGILDLSVAPLTGGDTSIEVTVTDVLGADEKLLVSGAINLSPGINNANSKIRFFEASPLAEANPITINIPARFGALVSGTKCFFEAKRYNQITGAQSPVVVIDAVVA